MLIFKHSPLNLHFKALTTWIYNYLILYIFVQTYRPSKLTVTTQKAGSFLVPENVMAWESLMKSSPWDHFSTWYLVLWMAAYIRYHMTTTARKKTWSCHCHECTCGWSWGECTGAVHHNYVRSKNIKLFVIPKFFQNNHRLRIFLFWHWQWYIHSSFNFSNFFYQKEKFPSHSYPKKHKKNKSLRTMFFRR